MSLRFHWDEPSQEQPSGVSQLWRLLWEFIALLVR